MTPVESSSIAAVGHDPHRSELTIQFKSGDKYRYSGVTAKHHADLIGAKSIGAHFQQHVRNRFQATKIA